MVLFLRPILKGKVLWKIEHYAFFHVTCYFICYNYKTINSKRHYSQRFFFTPFSSIILHTQTPHCLVTKGP